MLGDLVLRGGAFIAPVTLLSVDLSQHRQGHLLVSLLQLMRLQCRDALYLFKSIISLDWEQSEGPSRREIGAGVELLHSFLWIYLLSQSELRLIRETPLINAINIVESTPHTVFTVINGRKLGVSKLSFMLKPLLRGTSLQSLQERRVGFVVLRERMHLFYT